MKIAVLLCLPAWCHGEHGLPRPSLVQVSSRGTAHAKAVADSMSSTLAGFQKFTDDLVDQYKKQAPPAQSESYTTLANETGIDGHNTTNPEMGNETRGAVEKVLQYIDEFFKNAVVGHNMDQDTIQDCTDRICYQACTLNTTKVVTEATRVTDQANKILECLDREIALGLQHSEACRVWDEYRVDVDTQLPNCVYSPDDVFCQQTVAQGDIEFEKGELCDNKIKANEEDEDEADKLSDMEDCLEEVHDWLYTTKPKSDACERGDQQGLVCQPPVEEYHADHCEYVEVLQLECNNYDLCVQGCNAHCDRECDDIDIKSQARMADNETGERIKCLLKTLLNETVIDKTAGLDACINDAAKSRYRTWASYFHLTCRASADTPSYPEVVPCAERDQAVSLSMGYMENLMTNVVPLLKTTDQNNPDVASNAALWSSCASTHQCTAVSGATDTQWSEERC